jgi:hypothetical protein
MLSRECEAGAAFAVAGNNGNAVATATQATAERHLRSATGNSAHS